MVEDVNRRGTLVGIGMCHLFDEVVEFATDAGQIRNVAVAQAMPIRAIFWQRSTAAS